MKILIHDLRPEMTPTRVKADSLYEELTKNNKKVGPFELIDSKYNDLPFVFSPWAHETKLSFKLISKIDAKLELKRELLYAILWDTAIMYDNYVIKVVHGLWTIDVCISIESFTERLPIDVSAENYQISPKEFFGIRFSDFKFYFGSGRLGQLGEYRYEQTPNRKRLERIKSFFG